MAVFILALHLEDDALDQLQQLAEHVHHDQDPHPRQRVVDSFVAVVQHLLHLVLVVLVADADHAHAQQQSQEVYHQEPEF